MKESKKKQYLLLIFILGLILFNYPVLGMYNVPERWLGIPVLFIMVFFSWMLLIVLTFFVTKKGSE